MSLKTADLNRPRQKAIAALRASLPADLWRENEGYVASLREEIATHAIARHPAISILKSGELGLEAMAHIHLEYRHAIVQIFTDALMAAQLECRQLEPRLAPSTKMAPRFLLALNDLDEFGFRPGLDIDGYYRGNPAVAHYPLFEAVLDDYGISREARQVYQPSPLAAEVRRHLEQGFESYVDVVALLAVAEQEVILFSPALRDATAALGLQVNDGYYHVHGVSEDAASEAADDDHEDDLWYILTQAITPDQYVHVRQTCLKYSDLWVGFWTHQMQIAAFAHL